MLKFQVMAGAVLKVDLSTALSRHIWLSPQRFLVKHSQSVGAVGGDAQLI